MFDDLKMKLNNFLQSASCQNEKQELITPKIAYIAMDFHPAKIIP
jgi:hypothetical protein